MRYSRQRELIIDAVMANGQHPTAQQVYQAVRQESASISLGTVYRNLNQLTEAGELLRIPMHGGKDRFDHETCVHFHLQCARCGALEDVPAEISADMLRLLARIRRQTSMTVSPESLQFQGICHTCATKLQEAAPEESTSDER